MYKKTSAYLWALSFIVITLFFSPGCGEKSPSIEETIYTRSSPGPWQGKEDGHVPKILVGKKETGLEVQVSVNHVMDADTPHYIMFIKIFDENDKLLGETNFNPDSEAAVATFSLTTAPKKITALEKCNLHGTWSAEIELD